MSGKTEIKLYNPITKKKEVFTPLKEGEVSMYVCGVTPYNYAHIGNARPAIVFDTLYRFLKSQGYKVKYARNFTDIDDKIIARAKEEGVTTKEITEKYIAQYHKDMKALNVLGEADDEGIVEPRVSNHLPEIIEIIQLLLDKGIAYTAPSGDVLYDTTKFEDYGKLAHKKLDELIAGARVEVSDEKRNPTDFVLWKAAKEEEPAEVKWDVIWEYQGEKIPASGRPGWHIECSAMSKACLCEKGETTIDIHGGGEDLKFPHHSCEIAQSEGAYGKKYARHWMHNAFVKVDGEKMSKSLGNFMLIHDLRDNYTGEAIRLWMLSTHYRKPVDLGEEALDVAEKRLLKWERQVHSRACKTSEINSQDVKIAEGLWRDFSVALYDDLNTLEAISIIEKVLKFIHQTFEVSHYDEVLKNMLEVLGLEGVLEIGYRKRVEYIAKVRRKFEDIAEQLIENEEVDIFIEQRNAAKAAKDYTEADRIRDELSAKGIILEDGPSGTTWRRK